MHSVSLRANLCLTVIQNYLENCTYMSDLIGSSKSSGGVDANIKVGIDSSDIDAYLAKYNEAMNGKDPANLKQELADVSREADDTNDKVGNMNRELRVADRAMRKLVPQYGQLRQFQQMYKNFNVGNFAMVGFLIVNLAVQLLQRINQAIVAFEQKQIAAEVTIREAQGFSSAEYQSWHSGQKGVVTSRNINL